MSFAVFTDSCSNLPGSLLQHFGIRVLPCSYTVDGKQIIYGGDIEAFDAHTYYELLRQGKRVTTSLLNTQVFLDHFRPALEQGLDVVYVGLSAGISGTYQAACIAAAELRDEFPERTVCPVDSMGAGFGTGLLACRAAELRDEGRSAARGHCRAGAGGPEPLRIFHGQRPDVPAPHGPCAGSRRTGRHGAEPQAHPPRR